MFNWDNLIQAIREDKCVVLLGPNALELDIDGETKSLKKFLLDSLQQYHKRDLMAFYEEDELFLFRNASSKNESYFTIKSLLEKNQLKGDIIKKIAGIDLHLLLSFTPYLNPKKNWPKLNIPHNFHYGMFHMKRGSTNSHEPTSEAPLIYDFYGSVEEEESIVLTHADLFEYIRSILGAKEIDTALRSALQRARYFIFLGFNFDKWYVQLMLRLLMNIKQNQSAYTWVAPKVDKGEDVMDFLTNEFDIRMIGEIDGVRDFVDKLHTECQKAGLLKELPEGAEEPRELQPDEKIENWLKADELEDALDFMSEYFESKTEDDLADQTMMIQGQLARLKRKEKQGILSNDEADRDRNKIRVNIQDLNKELKALV